MCHSYSLFMNRVHWTASQHPPPKRRHRCLKFIVKIFQKKFSKLLCLTIVGLIPSYLHFINLIPNPNISSSQNSSGFPYYQSIFIFFIIFNPFQFKFIIFVLLCNFYLLQLLIRHSLGLWGPSHSSWFCLFNPFWNHHLIHNTLLYVHPPRFPAPYYAN